MKKFAIVLKIAFWSLIPGGAIRTYFLGKKAERAAIKEQADANEAESQAKILAAKLTKLEQLESKLNFPNGETAGKPEVPADQNISFPKEG